MDMHACTLMGPNPNFWIFPVPASLPIKPHLSLYILVVVLFYQSNESLDRHYCLGIVFVIIIIIIIIKENVERPLLG